MQRDSILEICDICGKISEEFIQPNGLIVCKECAEEFDFKENPEACEYCVFCGWPINRITTPEILRGYFKIIKKWLEKENGKEIIKILEKRAENILNKNLASCRYDFFEYIQKIIEIFSSKLGKKFKKEFVDNFDFQGGMIT